jgi:hypothetical protein
LDPDHSYPIHWFAEAIGCARQRVADGKNRRCAFEKLERRKQAIDHIRRAEGAGSIMHQDRFA